MTSHILSWFRRHWILLLGLLLLLGAGAAAFGILTWKRGTKGRAKENLDNVPTESGPILMLSQYTPLVNAMVFSPDGKQLATAALDMNSGMNRTSEIRVWDTASGKERRGSQDFSGLLSSLAFSPDGKMLASGGIAKVAEAGGRSKESGEVRLLNLDSAAAPSPWQKAEKPVVSVAFSPDGDRLAAGCGDGKLTLYNRATGQAELVLQANPGANLTSNAAFSADGRKIAWGGVKSSGGPKIRFEGVIQLWDAATGKPLTTLHLPDNPKGTPSIKSLAFLPDGGKLVAGCEWQIFIWDVNTGQIAATLSGHTNRIEAIALSRDGRLLASIDNDGGIKLWQMSTQSERATLQNLMPTPQSPKQGMGLTLAFSPDGQTLASSTFALTGSEGRGVVKLWDVPSAKEIVLSRLAEGRSE